MSPLDSNPQRAAEVTRIQTKAVLICSVNNELYGIGVDDVLHLAVVGKIWKLPELPPAVMGVTKIRNRLCPLIDLRVRLGLPRRAQRARICAVEIDSDTPMAVAVDSVEEIKYVEADAVHTVESLRTRFNVRAITGMVTVGDRMCMLLDLPWILTGRASGAFPSSTTMTAPPAVISATQADAATSDEHSTQPVPRPRARRSTATRVEPGAAALSVIGVPPSRTQARKEHLLAMLSRATVVGRRRVPGFRPTDPRLPALAAGLLEMPPEFRTLDAAPVVAAHLGRTPQEYRVSHFRYDLGKLRARHLAERIGSSRRYRLTGIGRIVCHIVAKRRQVVQAPRVHTTREFPRQSAISA